MGGELASIMSRVVDERQVAVVQTLRAVVTNRVMTKSKRAQFIYHWALPIVATGFSANPFNEHPDRCVVNS